MAATRAGGSGGGRRGRGRRRREGTGRPGRRVRPGGRAAAARPGRANGDPSRCARVARTRWPVPTRASGEGHGHRDSGRAPPSFVTPPLNAAAAGEQSLQVARKQGRGRRGGLASGTVALCGRIAHGRERPSPEALYPRKLCRTARPRRGRPEKGKTGVRKLAWRSS